MIMSRTQFHSRVAKGQRAGRRMTAGQGRVVKGGTAVECPGSFAAYLPGGKLRQPEPMAGINLQTSDHLKNHS